MEMTKREKIKFGMEYLVMFSKNNFSTKGKIWESCLEIDQAVQVLAASILTFISKASSILQTQLDGVQASPLPFFSLNVFYHHRLHVEGYAVFLKLCLILGPFIILSTIQRNVHTAAIQLFYIIVTAG